MNLQEPSELQELYMKVAKQDKVVQQCYEKEDIKDALTTFAREKLAIVEGQVKRSKDMDDFLIACKVTVKLCEKVYAVLKY